MFKRFLPFRPSKSAKSTLISDVKKTQVHLRSETCWEVAYRAKLVINHKISKYIPEMFARS